MTKSLVKFSGTDYGLLMRLEWEAPLPQLLVELEEHLQQSRDFFVGANVLVEIGSRPLLSHELEQLRVVLERYEVTLQGVIAASPGQERRPPPPATPPLPQPFTDPRLSLHTEHRTLRSGEKIAADGYVVIVGDVNPGAEVIAGSSIFVWGSLKGSAYAGVPDQTDAVIAALHLTPIQLGIAGLIARPPETRTIQEPGPELARVDHDAIVVETWERGRVFHKRG
jgi:septum site-determining protein MinC